MIKFYKYQGAGNDFVMIDNRQNIISKNDKFELVQKLCQRRFGIGSDGLIFIEKHIELDFKMDFFNPDGSQSFCGNGSRCAIAFARDLGIIKSERTKFDAIDGPHEAFIIKNNVKVSMSNVNSILKIENDFFIDTGSPHYITYRNDVDQEDVIEIGRSIRYSDAYKPNGTNVNLVQQNGQTDIKIRTYERGVEAETFACGTGATACAISFAEKNKITKGVVNVKVLGGELKVYFSKDLGVYQDIWLEGPGVLVYEGQM